LFKRLRAAPVRRAGPACIRRKQCDVSCPTGNEFPKAGAVQEQGRATFHGCAGSLPARPGILSSSQRKRSQGMKTNPTAAVLASVLIIIAGVLIIDSLGVFRTGADRTPQLLAGATVREEAPANDPMDIRGSSTFGEISRLFGVPLEDLARAFGLEEGKADAFKVKELKSIYTDEASEVGTSSVRLFVAWYKSLPYERREDSFLPVAAVTLLREKAALAAEQLEYLTGHAYGGK